MGINPFEMRYPVERAEHLIDRKVPVRELRMAVRSRQNAMLVGPEGSGKTALLECAFDRDYRLEMARKGVLIDVGSFPAEYGGEDVYGYFADAIVNSLYLLDLCGRETEAQALRAMLNKEYDSKKSRFDGYLKAMGLLRFHMVFVLDCFENFTSSEKIKSEHHDTLRSMVDGRMNLQLVVATNYDFNKTSLPEGARNSALLTRFTARVQTEPLNLENSERLLLRCLEEFEDDFRFTPEQIGLIHSLSGGIPELLYKVAAVAYEELFYGQRPGWEDLIRNRSLELVRPVLNRWLKYVTDEQAELLGELPYKNNAFDQNEMVAAAALVDRGVLVKPVELNAMGRPIEQDGYLYNSELLADYCSHEDWLKAALEQNPFRSKWEPLFNADELAEDMPVGGFVDVEEISEVRRENGFGRLFRLLDTPALLQHVMLPVTTLLALPAPEEEREERVEQAAAQIAAQFIPEEVEQELDGYEEEEMTLERRFRMVRFNVDPEGLLSDELLDSLSHKCRLYLQIAFVVDDALQILRDFRIGDLSAQIVMYGKVLEQHLRDTLFDFFSREPGLCHYDTKTRREDPDSGDAFANMDVRFAFIGNFVYMIREKKGHLGALCTKWGLRLQDRELGEDWWQKLAKDVDRARKLRNGGDHAGSETSEKGITTMRRLMLSSDGILTRCGSGPLLCRALEQEQERSRSMTLIGSVTQFRCTTLMENGGVEGWLPEFDRPGAIAAKRLEGLGEAALLLDCEFPVRIMAYDAKRNLLTLTPVVE